jgi:hypothetical protein
MTPNLTISFLGGAFILFAFIAFSSYMRILVILSAIDRGLENPPDRKQLQDKLRAYRDWCKDRHRIPYHLIFFSIGVIGIILSWIPIPWFVFR